MDKVQALRIARERGLLNPEQEQMFAIAEQRGLLAAPPSPAQEVTAEAMPADIGALDAVGQEQQMAAAQVPPQPAPVPVPTVEEQLQDPEFLRRKQEEAAVRRAEIEAETPTLAQAMISEVPGVVRDVGREVAQGMTLGFADESEAAIRAALGPGSYEDNLDKVRGEIAQARAESPKAMMAAEVLGGIAVPGGILAKGAAKSASLGKKAVEGMKAGAIAGAGYGFGAGEEGLAERALSAGIGGVGGAAGGTMIPIAGAAVRMAGKIANGIKKAAVGTGKTPEDIIKQTGLIKQKAAQYAQELDEAVKNNRTINLADLDRGAAGLARTLRKVGGEAQEEVERNLVNRAGAEQSRIMKEANKRVSGKTYFENLDELEAAYDESTRDAFGQAFKHGPIQSKKMTSILGRIEDSAKGMAKRIAKMEGKEVGDETSTQTLHYYKKGLDNIIDGNIKNPMTGELNEIGRAASNLRRELADEIKNLNPMYEKAMHLGGDKIRIKNAQDMGQKYMLSSPDVLKKNVEKMGPAERDAMLVGVKDKILTEIQKATDQGSSAKKVIGNELKRQQLKAAFAGREKDYNDFRKSLEDEVRSAETYNKIMGGGSTDVNLAEGNRFNRMIGALKSGVQGIADLTIGQAANVLEKRMAGISPKNARLLAKALTDPESSAAMMRRIADESSEEQTSFMRGLVTSLVGPRETKRLAETVSAKGTGFLAGMGAGTQAGEMVSPQR